MIDTLIAIAVVIAALAATWFGGRKRGKTDANNKTALAAAERQAKTQEEINHADLGIGASDVERVKRLREFADK